MKTIQEIEVNPATANNPILLLFVSDEYAQDHMAETVYSTWCKSRLQLNEHDITRAAKSALTMAIEAGALGRVQTSMQLVFDVAYATYWLTDREFPKTKSPVELLDILVKEVLND